MLKPKSSRFSELGFTLLDCHKLKIIEERPGSEMISVLKSQDNLAIKKLLTK